MKIFATWTDSMGLTLIGKGKTEYDALKSLSNMQGLVYTKHIRFNKSDIIFWQAKKINKNAQKIYDTALI